MGEDADRLARPGPLGRLRGRDRARERVHANQAAWEAWEGGDFPDAPRVHNYSRDLGLVREEPGVVRRHRKLLDRLKWR